MKGARPRGYRGPGASGDHPLLARGVATDGRAGALIQQIGGGRKLLEHAGSALDCGRLRPRLELLPAAGMVRALADHAARIASQNPVD
jgi:hypothetical protein